MNPEIQEQIKLATEKLKSLPEIKQAAIWETINVDENSKYFGNHSYGFNFDQNAEVGDTQDTEYNIIRNCVYIVKRDTFDVNEEIQEQIKLATEKLKEYPTMHQALIWERTTEPSKEKSYYFTFENDYWVGDSVMGVGNISICVHRVINPIYEDTKNFEQESAKKAIEANTEKSINLLVSSIFTFIDQKHSDIEGWSVWKAIRTNGGITYFVHPFCSDIGHIETIPNGNIEICITSIPNFYYNPKP